MELQPYQAQSQLVGLHKGELHSLVLRQQKMSTTTLARMDSLLRIAPAPKHSGNWWRIHQWWHWRHHHGRWSTLRKWSTLWQEVERSCYGTRNYGTRKRQGRAGRLRQPVGRSSTHRKQRRRLASGQVAAKQATKKASAAESRTRSTERAITVKGRAASRQRCVTALGLIGVCRLPRAGCSVQYGIWLKHAYHSSRALIGGAWAVSLDMPLGSLRQQKQLQTGVPVSVTIQTRGIWLGYVAYRRNTQ